MFVSSSTGSVQESLYHHFKEAIGLKSSPEFLREIVLSIAFYFHFINTNHRGGSGKGCRPAAFLYHWCPAKKLFSSPCQLRPSLVVHFPPKKNPYPNSWSFPTPSILDWAVRLLLNFIQLRCRAIQINPAFLDVTFIRGNHLSILLLFLSLLIWGRGVHRGQCLSEQTW